MTVVYARFSSDRQNETSIDAQVRACQEYASKNGLRITKEYIDEAVSGKGSAVQKRLAYQRMLRDAKLGKFHTILIHKWDRVGRNLFEHVMLSKRLEEYGVKIIAAGQDFGDSKEGRMMTSIQWIMSEYYIDNLSEETRKGLKEIALKGLHTGGLPPFGYDIVDQGYTINPIEAPWVQKMFNAAINREGYTQLIKEMAEAGITGKRGKPIKGPQINEILHNEKYTGVYLYTPVQAKKRADRRLKVNAIRIEGVIPQIVSPEVWKEVQKIMSERRQNSKVNYRCSGLVYCGNCGAKMHVITSRSKGHEYHYYCCSNHCGQKTVSVEKVDRLANIVIQRFLSPENVQAISDEMQLYANDEETMIREFEKTRKEKLDQLHEKKQNLMANLASGLLNDTVAALVNEELVKIDKDIKKTETLEPLRDYNPQLIKGWMNKLLMASEDELPKMLIERIEIKNNKATIRSIIASLLGEYGCGGSTSNRLATLRNFIESILSL